MYKEHSKRRSRKRRPRKLKFGNQDTGILDTDIKYVLQNLKEKFYVKGGKAMTIYISGIKSLDWDLEIEGDPMSIIPKLIKKLEQKTGKNMAYEIYDSFIFRIRAIDNKSEDPYFMDITFIKNINPKLFIDNFDGINYLNIYELYMNMIKESKEYEEMLEDLDYMNARQDELLNKAKKLLKQREYNLYRNLEDLKRENTGSKSDLREIKEQLEEIDNFHKLYNEELMSIVNILNEKKKDKIVKEEYDRIIKKYNKTKYRIDIINKAIENPSLYLTDIYLQYLLKHCPIKNKYNSIRESTSIQESTNIIEMYMCNKII